jgi:hypothetical protein
MDRYDRVGDNRTELEADSTVFGAISQIGEKIKHLPN